MVNVPSYVLADEASTLVMAAYTAGQGFLVVEGLQNFPTPTAAAPIVFTVVVAATYGNNPEVWGTYSAIGATNGNQLTGLTLLDGTDNTWQVGDIVEMRTSAPIINAITAYLASIQFLTPTSTQITNYIANPADLVFCNLSAGSFTVGLPAQPADGTPVGVYLVGVTGASVLTVQSGTGDTLFWTGGPTTLTMSITDQLYAFVYSAIYAAWYILASYTPTPTAGSNILISNSGGIQSISASGGGGGGSPGGSSGQIQYDNAGFFGGFTASGDATINTTTGAVTVTKTSGVAFATSATVNTTNASNITTGTLPGSTLPAFSGAIITAGGTAATAFGPIAADTLIANATGGLGTPGATTLTALIDAAIGSTTGSILTRSASVWEVAPDFGYDITNNCPKFTAIADPATPAAGDLWTSTATNGLTAIPYVDSSANIWEVALDGTFFRCGSCTALSSFSGGSSMLGSPANARGSLTIPISVLAVGQIIEIWFSAVYSATGSSYMIISPTLNGSNIAGSGTGAIPGAATSYPCGTFSGPITIAVTAIGTSGSVFTGGSVLWMRGADAGTMYYVCNGASGVGTSTPFTVATNAAITLGLVCTNQTSSGSNAIQVLNFQARIRG
jgi:hypothetical protein